MTNEQLDECCNSDFTGYEPGVDLNRSEEMMKSLRDNFRLRLNLITEHSLPPISEFVFKDLQNFLKKSVWVFKRPNYQTILEFSKWLSKETLQKFNRDVDTIIDSAQRQYNAFKRNNNLLWEKINKLENERISQQQEFENKMFGLDSEKRKLERKQETINTELFELEKSKKYYKEFESENNALLIENAKLTIENKKLNEIVEWQSESIKRYQDTIKNLTDKLASITEKAVEKSQPVESFTIKNKN